MDVTRIHSASREVEGSGELKQTKIRPAARCQRDRDGMVGRAELGRATATLGPRPPFSYLSFRTAKRVTNGP